MSAIRRHPRITGMLTGLLALVAGLALLGPPATANENHTDVHKKILRRLRKLCDKVATLQATVDSAACDPARSWIVPGCVEERFELVFPVGDTYQAVLDHKTGLIWQRRPVYTLRSYDDAWVYAEVSTVGGELGWRLPFKGEILSLMHVDANGQRVVVPEFPELPGAVPAGTHRFWTQSTRASHFIRPLGGGSFELDEGRTSISSNVGMNLAGAYNFAGGNATAYAWYVMGPGGAHR